ncbi:DUF4153 domain-containing protein [Erythrobacter alti]|uniref:DUF4153 domain-containing protein n=1 Tax=Erythrobacter alti TaxID=1896145 RepID=UPI0030F41F89
MTGATQDEKAPVEQAVLLEDWPLRPWILAVLGAIAGLGVYELLEDFDTEPLRAALAALMFFGAIAAGFVLRPQRLAEAAIFALGIGLVMAGIAYFAVNAHESHAGEEFAFAAGVFFSVLAIPLFQANFHRLRWDTPYPATHFYVWTDAVSAGGAFLFMGLSWALLWLLHGLFSLIGIDVIEELIQTGWFSAMFVGLTFGAALGVLRNQLGIIGTLQRVVMLVFSLLAVPFALALLIFLVILLFSGGSALWDATDSATPVLLTCAVGCFVLSNAVVRDDDAQRSSSAFMQSAALVLAFCILPLTVFAAISMGIRIDQHGLSPERIWALIAIVIACSYGLAYWVGLARGRMAGWSQYLRRANMHLAVVTCGIALVLAFPLIDFGGISAKNQVARLDAGKVSLEEFDLAALRWDFGDAGREVLAELAEREGEVAQLAQAAQAQTERPYDYGYARRVEADYNLRVQPDDPELREFIIGKLQEQPWKCQNQCLALDIGRNADGQRQVALIQHRAFEIYTMGGDEPADTPIPEPDRNLTSGELKEDSVVEIHTIPQRYIVIDGVPMQAPLGAEGEVAIEGDN